MEPGAIVDGRYRLESLIGAGGAGVVWKAVQLPFDDVVALKQIPLQVPGGEAPERVRARTLREARNTRVLRDVEHVIGVSDYVEDEANVWLAIEYVDALNLAELVAAAGPLPPGEVAWIGARVARALAAGHALDIQHRDVKPGNVLVGRDGATVKLGDYGISRREDDPDVTVVGSIPATLPYAAPEVVREHATTTASDVWSLGATLYAAVEGHPPHGRPDDRASMIEAVRGGLVEPMLRAGPELVPVLERMLVLTAHGRIDADTAAEKLERVATPLSARTRAILADHRPDRQRHLPFETLRLTGARSAEAPPVAGARPWPLRGRRPLAITLVLVLALAALGVWRWTHPPAAPQGVASAPDALSGLPTSIGYRALADAGADIDTCQLMDIAGLGELGPTSVVPGFDYEACLATLKTPHGVMAVTLDPTADWNGVTPVRRPSRDLGGVDVASGAVPATTQFACTNYVVLSDNSSNIGISASYVDGGDSTSALCDVTDVATVGAVQALDRLGRVPRDPGRSAAMALKDVDPCTLVDRTRFPEFTGRPDARFGGWSCNVGAGGAGWVLVEYQFGTPFAHRTRIGPYWAQPGVTSRLLDGNNKCSVRIEVRARAAVNRTRYDGVTISSYGRKPTADQCDRARRIAEDVVATNKLPPPE